MYCTFILNYIVLSFVSLTANNDCIELDRTELLLFTDIKKGLPDTLLQNKLNSKEK